jgi:hypothetical protein
MDGGESGLQCLTALLHERRAQSGRDREGRRPTLYALC